MSLNDLLHTKTSSSGQGEGRRGRVPSWLLPGSLAIGFLLIFLVIFGNRLKPSVPVKVAPVVTIRLETPPPESIEETETKVRDGPKTLLFQASGWVEPDPYVISVPVLVGGIVDEVFVLEGDAVKKGQPLATLIDDDVKLDLAGAKTRLETLKSQLEVDKSRIPQTESKKTGYEKNVLSEKARLEELKDRLSRLQSLPKGSIPVGDVRAAELQVEQQQAKLEEARARVPEAEAELKTTRLEIAASKSALVEAEVAVARAQLALDRHRICSPMDGVVLQLHAAPGAKRMVHMDNPKSAFIVELFDPKKLQARIDVPLSEAAALSVGQPVEMTTDLLSNVEFNGVVTRITGEADLQRNTLQVKVAIQNPDRRLRPEMLVRGKFFSIPVPVSSGKGEGRKTDSRRLSIFVPEEAIFSGNIVWVVTPSERAEQRMLSLGKETKDLHRRAIGGIKSGEKVILPPHDRLKPGIRVRIL